MAVGTGNAIPMAAGLSGALPLADTDAPESCVCPVASRHFNVAPWRAVLAHPNDAYAEAVRRALVVRGYEISRCSDRKALRRELFPQAPSLLITELRLADGPVMELLGALREASPDTRIVVITAHDSIATAVRCMRLGVNAYYSEQEPLERVLDDDDFSVSRQIEPQQPLRLERALWEYVNRVVDQAGSITRAAEVLGLDRRSLRRMLGKYAPPP